MPDYSFMCIISAARLLAGGVRRRTNKIVALGRGESNQSIASLPIFSYIGQGWRWGDHNPGRRPSAHVIIISTFVRGQTASAPVHLLVLTHSDPGAKHPRRALQLRNKTNTTRKLFDTVHYHLLIYILKCATRFHSGPSTSFFFRTVSTRLEPRSLQHFSLFFLPLTRTC